MAWAILQGTQVCHQNLAIVKDSGTCFLCIEDICAVKIGMDSNRAAASLGFHILAAHRARSQAVLLCAQCLVQGCAPKAEGEPLNNQPLCRKHKTKNTKSTRWYKPVSPSSPTIFQMEGSFKAFLTHSYLGLCWDLFPMREALVNSF